MFAITSIFGVLIFSYITLTKLLKNKKKNEKEIKISENISCHQIAKHVTFFKSKEDKSNIHSESQQRNLVVYFSWMNAKPKDTYKYVDIWLKRGFDVLRVQTTPWQFLWPVRGSQVTAAVVLDFLSKADAYPECIIHGMSVGAYFWGEALVKMSYDMEKYQKIRNKIVGLFWDSCTDVDIITTALPTAMFPNNKILAYAVKTYIGFHLKVFDKIATRHYMKSSHSFHNKTVRAPVLMYVSKADPLTTVNQHYDAKANWESFGMKVSLTIFEDSPHVGHLWKYPQEYLTELDRFLDSLKLDENKEQINR